MTEGDVSGLRKWWGIWRSSFLSFGSFLNKYPRHFIIYAPLAEQESCRSKIQWQRHEEHCRETRSGSSAQVPAAIVAGGPGCSSRARWMENQPWNIIED